MGSEMCIRDRTVRCAWVYGPALVLLAFAPSVWTLGLALLIFGAVHGAMDVAMNGWGGRVEAQSGRSTMSVFHALFSLGAGLGAASGYIAVSIELSLEMHYLLVALIGGVAGLGIMISPSGRDQKANPTSCLLYTSPSPRDLSTSRMPSSA